MPHRRITVDDAVTAVNDVLSKLRESFTPVTAETKLDELGLASIDYVEIFIVLEDLTGCAPDTTAPPELGVVGDLAKMRCL